MPNFLSFAQNLKIKIENLHKYLIYNKIHSIKLFNNLVNKMISFSFVQPLSL